jgi:type I restriction enzyme, S subunit
MWREEKIGNEIDVIRGVSFPKSAKESEYQEGRVACLRTANVQKEVNWSDLWFIDKDHVNREEQFVQVNDILISTANSLELLGKVSLVRKLPFESTLGTFIVNIRVPDGISPKFIYYQLCGRDFLEQVWSKASTTTNISNLSTTKLKDITLKFPPLPTQNRIVEKIEELFSELDNGVENLKKAQKQLKTYRQAVLKDAFEGKLTKEWREQQDDLPTPEELLQQIKAERKAHRQRELAEWEKEVEQWEKDGKPGRKPRKP